MAKRQFRFAGLTAAVAYLRMSDKKQDKSIPAQKAEIEKYAAAHGYQIVRWYRDEGISGAEGRKRAGFQQLILDAQQNKDFEVILVWDQDRFSRFDPMEANYYWFLLRQAGVKLVSVTEGELDFVELGGWLKASVLQHGKAQYLRDLSRNVLRGRLLKAQRGKWQANRAPYGYQIVNRGDLAIDDDTAAIVIRIFRQYADTDSSLWDIAHDLNVEGIPSPGGKQWKSASVREVLRRECYVTGKIRQLYNPKGKFHAVINGDIVPVGNGYLDSGEGITIDCPRLVDEELWTRTQEHLRRRQKSTTPGKRTKSSVLIGLMYCANCGGNKMYAGDRARGKHACLLDRVYWCSSYHHHGKHACTRNLVHEQPILDYLLPKLQEMLLSPSNLERLANALRRQATEGKKPKNDGTAYRKRLSEMDAEIIAAARELKRTPDDLYDLAVEDLRRLRKERAQVAAALGAAEAQNTGGELDVESTVKAALDRARRMADVLQSADRNALRYALGELIERIDLWFEPIRGKKIVRSALKRGVIQLRKSAQLMAPASLLY